MTKFGLIFLLVLAMIRCDAQPKPGVLSAVVIERQLAQPMPSLNFPASVKRFYLEGRFIPAWITDNEGPNAKWQAMLLIDCVLQYGLSPGDYHPNELTYDKLHTIAETPDKISSEQKARFDIMLTDAMITMINYLHYGKLNPDYGRDALDNGVGLPFKADRELRVMLWQADFKAGMLSVQPRSKMYADLQYKMHLVKGLYDGDCYEVPEATVRRIAINMERLRWAEIDDSEAYVHINIPSFKLTYHLPESEKEFKVIVGAALTPTPVLRSKIEYFTTAPEWKVPENIFTREILPQAIKDPAYLDQNDLTIYNQLGRIDHPDVGVLKSILKAPKGYYVKQASGCDNTLGLLVFHFQNIYSVYLHDTPNHDLFKLERRDMSNGCIRVEGADELATLLLRNDQQEQRISRMRKNIAKEKHGDFVLRRAVPVKVTYLTCQITDGELISYNDIYALDKSLEIALYNVSDPLTLR